MDDIQQLEKTFQEKLASASTAEQAVALGIEFLGRKGHVTQLLQKLGTLPKEERAEFGKHVNLLKRAVETALAEKLAQFKEKQALSVEGFDGTLPGILPPQGSLHPIIQTIHELLDIFIRMGFEVVDGREVETERYNFTALNIPLDHPARDAFDTFYTQDGNLLRSQTSTVQIRVMEKRKPPLRIVAPGRVYRPDEMDASHSFMFHQIEGFMVDEAITFSDLKGVLHLFIRQIFGNQIKVRFRPHFFPFTEPSVEVDVSCVKCKGKGCSVCSRTGWLEILGAGCINPRVFEAVGYPKGKYRGFAFGLGVERMAMLRHGIHDIRLFYENDVQFLRQF